MGLLQAESMNTQQLLILGLLFLVLLLCVLVFGLLGRAGHASRARNYRAREGEMAAEALLEALGYRVIDRQIRESGRVWLDGEVFEFEVRADLLVERDEERFGAEVKTGRLAPDPGYPPTRRQLREYWRVFDDCGILLVDAESGTVTEVCFDEPR